MDWSTIAVSSDGTHHVRDGEPLYADRFDDVLAFHTPGLAAVRRGLEAWHIRPDSCAAYTRRFRRTFGFYEGLAAVVDHDGAHHVHPGGTDLASARYSWCGNFQGGRCAVRDRGGRYFHITSDGSRAYEHGWRYAGDYRDGIAVVQADDGRSTHIDRNGAAIHGRWFRDLDVFHKRHARARDDDGWHHVDRNGRALYTRRFAMVEPFYNGQARVEGHDGALEVIAESGRAIVELRPALRSELQSLSGDLVGYWRTQALAVAVELEVLEVLPASLGTISERCGLEREGARRLMRALAEVHVVERDNELWRATSRGALLLRGHPTTLADAALEYAGPLGESWSHLGEALRRDSNWCAPDVFGDVARDPSRVEGHHRMLRSYARHDYPSVAEAMALGGQETVVDAGGGVGVLAEALLAKHPGLRVVLLDRPEVLDLVRLTDELRARLTLHAANIFEPWGVRGDAVVLARVLHDWNDVDAARILARAREALPPGSQLFIVEMILDEENPSGGLCDLHLLAASGGRERTRADYAQLLAAAGFALEKVVRLPALPSLIVGVAR